MENYYAFRNGCLKADILKTRARVGHNIPHDQSMFFSHFMTDRLVTYVVLHAWLNTASVYQQESKWQ